MADDNRIPYDPSLLEREQKLLEWNRLTPEQRAAKKQWLDSLHNREIAQGLAVPTRKTDERENGPVGPNGFRWNGIVHRPLSKSPFRFVARAWQAKDRCCDVDELPGILYDDAEPLLPDTTVRNLRDEVNAFFRHHGIPIHAAKRDRTVALLDGPPRKR